MYLHMLNVFKDAVHEAIHITIANSSMANLTTTNPSVIGATIRTIFTCSTPNEV